MSVTATAAECAGGAVAADAIGTMVTGAVAAAGCRSGRGYGFRSDAHSLAQASGPPIREESDQLHGRSFHLVLLCSV
jgi:hypothetical protein